MWEEAVNKEVVSRMAGHTTGCNGKVTRRVRHFQ